MKIVFIFAVALLVGSVAAQPANVLVYHDLSGGYGDAVVTAIGNVWPTASFEAYSTGAGQPLFNNALNTGTWDVIILECWYDDTDGLYWGGVNDLYDTGAAVIYASSWEWENGTSGQLALANAMGVTSTVGNTSFIPAYAWVPAHPICDGISDWSQIDPGINLKNTAMTVSDADPVTGWSASPAAGQAAICVANDGSSVISGYGVAYAAQNVAIWENILNFMWPGTSLQHSTWGAIKSSF